MFDVNTLKMIQLECITKNSVVLSFFFVFFCVFIFNKSKVFHKLCKLCDHLSSTNLA